MSLNIKNEEVHAAVRRLARELGVSQTSAVEAAVSTKLREIDIERDRAARRARMRAAVAAAATAYRGIDLRAVEADLYDEATGLPR